MESMTAPTGRKMYFLTDPIEDRARDWVDYKKNYEATFTAQLLYPGIANYEVMPWPERIYEGLYRTSANSDKREKIPNHYSTQMQVMVNTLNHMPLSENKVSGSDGIGVLMANSLMFQGFPIHAGYEDPQLSNFYGQALPLLKRGIPVKTVHLENVGFKETLKDINVLIMSYSNMKPADDKGHQYLADWVKKGGKLVYCGRDADPFQRVMEWWNIDGNSYNAPSEHLLGWLGIKAPFAGGEYSYGKGKVVIIRNDPKEFIMNENGDVEFIETVKSLYESKSGKTLIQKNALALTRGPYEIVSVLDENPDAAPYVLKGKFIDLFDPEIPVLDEKRVNPGTQAFLYNLRSVTNPKLPQVLASASRVYDEMHKGKSYSFVVKSPVETINVMRVLLPMQVTSAEVTDAEGNVVEASSTWDEGSNTCFLRFPNHPDGVKVRLGW
jgi:hypothetical protein